MEKTLIDELYEKSEMKSSTMTMDEFNKIPHNDLYIAYQKKKQEEIKEIKSDTN